ncbi:MAG: flagellar hook-length control protein FliK [Gemmobacter sp.]
MSALPATLITAWKDAGPGRIEIALAPEELGRLTIAVTGEGDGLRIAITADRPETLDLLRRHADQLLADLRQGGMGGALLSFGGGGGQGRSREGQGAESPAAPAQPAPIRLVAHPPPPHGHAALNLRL